MCICCCLCLVFACMSLQIQMLLTPGQAVLTTSSCRDIRSNDNTNDNNNNNNTNNTTTNNNNKNNNNDSHIGRWRAAALSPRGAPFRMPSCLGSQALQLYSTMKSEPAQCWNIGIPYRKSLCPVVICPTCVALTQAVTMNIPEKLTTLGWRPSLPTSRVVRASANTFHCFSQSASQLVGQSFLTSPSCLS